MSKVSINPFGDLIVKDPRKPEPVVAGINERPLQHLLASFQRFEAGAAPRPQVSSEGCQLVSSTQPGYGKSHLIGRLFRTLHARATLVYVLPFQNAGTVFQSLMLAVARELHFPDRMDVGSWDREEPSQLDMLAHAVMAHLVADIVATGKDIHVDGATPVEVIAFLRSNPLHVFNRGVSGPNHADWLRKHFDRLREPFESAVARLGLNIAAPAAWLRVLYAYAFNPFDNSIRRACLDWLTAQPLDAEELQKLGLRPADGVNPDTSAEEANELCRQRIVELCQLASFYRPFVLCFDQTEVYGHHAALARAFGKVVAVLVNEAPNQLTLVTCNQEPWTERIVPYLEQADLQRFVSPPVTLEGLNLEQARELIRLRLAAVGHPADEGKGQLSDEWLQSLFPTARNQMGARLFLQKCKEQWEPAPVAAVSLEQLYQQRINRLLASPKRHQFEPDILQWLVEEVAARASGISVEKIEENYFAVRWRTHEREILFGFAPGTHWKRWVGIAREITRKNEAGPAIKGVFFRAPSQPPIPGRQWKSAAEIDAAKARFLHLVQLRVEELAELYAARDLFAEAAQGDIPVDTEAVLQFLAERLAPWWQRLSGTVENEPTPAPATIPEAQSSAMHPLSGEVRGIVERGKFMSVDEVMSLLQRPGTTAEDVLKACGFSPEIKVHSHPNMVVLQWQSSG